MATVTATDKSALAPARPGLHTPEGFLALMAKGITEVAKRTFSEPIEGEEFFQNRSTSLLTETFQSVVGLGHIAENRDEDVIPHDEQALGFANTISNYVYRGRAGHSRTLMEAEQYGQLGDNQRELMDAVKRTMELILADVFNRAKGASGAAHLCEDGNYFLDGTENGTARNNPHPEGGTWGNCEAASAITTSSIYTAQLNAAAQVTERGHLAPRKVERLIIRPTDEKTVWEILRSDLRPTDSMNARNFQFGRFQYTVYHRLTSALIFYQLDGKNELYKQTRVAPSFESWQGADNPDIFWQRVRFAMGVGCNRPDAWRGGTVS